MGGCAQIVGNAVDDTTMREDAHTEFTEPVDLDNYAALCRIATGPMKALFVQA
jgi:hypothetical protein